ncbi:MAG: STAS domain-containing protein [Legionellaceae bacterium]|nr:STAS domain-containing protein [Legionellaceae bacterium]
MSDCVDFKLSADLTVHTVKLERDRLLLGIKEAKIKKLRLDLSEVNRCDSAGVALLIEIKRVCDKKNIDYSFYAVPKEVHSLAEFCGIDGILI